MTSTSNSITRRDFVRVSLTVGGGLLVSVSACAPDEAPHTANAVDSSTSGRDQHAPGFGPNAFLQINADGSVIVFSKHAEMGQGAYTGLATIIADELDAEWSRVTVRAAPADAARFANLAFGMQGTGGSTAIANSWTQHRQAGATARAVLMAAAAAKWSVPVTELTTEPGVVVHASTGRRTDYGSLAATAATLAVPETVSLKDSKDFRYIGKERVASRVDVPAKSMGAATYTQDVQLPGMLTAVVAHPPQFGATVARFDATKAKTVAGVVDVVQIPTGVAVLAESFWAARQGREALTVEWDLSKANTLGTAEVMAKFRALAETPGMRIRNDGDAEAALRTASVRVEAQYEFPYLAHASMEPLNCVVALRKDGAEIWNGCQFQTVDQRVVAELFGMRPDQVQINTLFAGGSFGRRANPKSDYVMEAASIAKAIDGRVPIKLVWTREDDIGAGYFRPAMLHRIRGGLNASGEPVAWWHRVVGQSVLAGSVFAPKDGKDSSSFEGAADHPYAVPNVFLDTHYPQLGIPVQWWRSVGHTHTAFAVEMFVDELAKAATTDPLEFRRKLLVKDPRRLAVLNLAAEKSGWGSALPAGRTRGIAVHQSFGSYVAEVAEVSLVNGAPRVHRVTCAVDCGVVVNPDIVRAQMEGAIAFGLGAALYGEIVIDRGRVMSKNFDSYRVLRHREMPVVDVHIVASAEPPSGVGEPGTPPIGPAVANALFALTGKPTRRVPLAVGG